MDPLDAIPPLGSQPPTPAAPARVTRAERDERRSTPDQQRSPGRHQDEPSDDDLEDFYDENWTQRFSTDARPPTDETGSGPHIDIIA